MTTYHMMQSILYKTNNFETRRWLPQRLAGRPQQLTSGRLNWSRLLRERAATAGISRRQKHYFLLSTVCDYLGTNKDEQDNSDQEIFNNNKNYIMMEVTNNGASIRLGFRCRRWRDLSLLHFYFEVNEEV